MPHPERPPSPPIEIPPDEPNGPEIPPDELPEFPPQPEVPPEEPDRPLSA